MSTALAAPIISTLAELASAGVSLWNEHRRRNKSSVDRAISRGEPTPALPKMLVKAGGGLGSSTVIYPVLMYLDLPCTYSLLSEAIVAGALAQVNSINPRALVVNWATRFQVVFQEYCLVGFRARVTNGPRGTGGTEGGVTCVYFDESTAAAPTANEALSHPHAELKNSGSDGGSMVSCNFAWVPRNFSELSWLSTAVDTASVYMKWYTNAGNFGTPATCTQSWNCDGTVRVAFRGLLA